MSSSEAVRAFIDAMRAAGVRPSSAIGADLASGERIHFHCEGDRAKTKKGWAVLHLDGRPAGAFGHYRDCPKQVWRGEAVAKLTREERAELARKARQDKARREAAMLQQHQAAASACIERWERAAPADPRHPYLVRKGVVGEGLRQEDGRLLVPMYDASGKLWNLQSIDGHGTKLFAKGARATNLHLLIGEPADRLVVAEGYGTAAVVRRATGLAVVVAFSSACLSDAALVMRERWPDAEIVIAADDDAHLVDHPTIQSNLGLEAARAAAQAVGGRVAIPPRRAT